MGKGSEGAREGLPGALTFKVIQLDDIKQGQR